MKKCRKYKKLCNFSPWPSTQFHIYQISLFGLVDISIFDSIFVFISFFSLCFLIIYKFIIIILPKTVKNLLIQELILYNPIKELFLNVLLLSRWFNRLPITEIKQISFISALLWAESLLVRWYIIFDVWPTDFVMNLVTIFFGLHCFVNFVFKISVYFGSYLDTHYPNIEETLLKVSKNE